MEAAASCYTSLSTYQIARLHIPLHCPGIFLLWRCDPTLVIAFLFLRFLDHTQQRITVGRTPLDE